MQYEPFLIGSRGIQIDEQAETSIEGLYSAGDEVGNFRADISGAVIFGWIAGGSAAERAKNAEEIHVVDSAVIRERVGLYSEFLGRDDGASWKEANLALQQIMQDYAGVEVRSETLLRAGLKYLQDLRNKALASLSADNSHTLMRCQEVLDLMDCGEVIIRAALERKETRERHIRSDYPFTNPLLQDKFLTVHKENDQVVLEWREKH
jgi:succinate dehydrogenase/fumarate reductase flavoprotein subunit